MANLPKTDISPMHVRNILDYPSTDIGTLCGGVAEVVKKINEWSPYKPFRLGKDFITDTDRETYCGFVINSLTKYLEYAPPRGGSSEPYRIGDYREYNHYAKKPSVLDLKLDLYVENKYNIANYSEFSFNFTLPQIQTLVKCGKDPSVNIDMISFRLSGITCNGTIGSNELNLNGKCAAKISDLGLSDTTSRTIFVKVTNINLKNYGANDIGDLYNLPIEVWYGNYAQEDFTKCKLHGGEYAKIYGKIVSTSVVVNYDAMTGDYPPINAKDSVCSGTFNQSAGTYSISNLQIKGDIKDDTTGEDVHNFERFKDNGMFRIQYIVSRNYNIIATCDNVLTAYPSVSSGTSASVNLQNKTYSVIIANGFTIGGLQKGDMILFRLNPD